MQDRVFSFLRNSITIPSYRPSPDDYMELSLLSYQFSTGQLPLTQSYPSPFESFYAFLTDSITSIFSTLSDHNSCEEQLQTAAWRSSVLDHIFGFCYSQSRAFVHFVDPLPISSFLSAAFLSFAQKIPDTLGFLIGKCVSELDGLFTASPQLDFG
jgi:hypothetical protein